VTKLRIGGKFKSKIKIKKGKVTINIAATTIIQNHLSFKIQLIENPRNCAFEQYLYVVSREKSCPNSQFDITLIKSILPNLNVRKETDKPS